MTPIITINLDDNEYPQLLKEITPPPKQLYLRGKIRSDLPLVAVVGTRRASRYGKQVTEELVGQLARAGVGIVSGLALGIDGVAHEAALSGDCYTIGVLGSGVDEHTIYPASHRRLAERIIEAGGAIISEYPPGFTPTRYSFPERNRIIAGLSQATLVTEAPEKSGALITAYHALDYNRDVFAVPHSITSPVGSGCNLLITKGATLAQNAVIILQNLNIPLAPQDRAPQLLLGAEEQRIYVCLSREPMHIDTIVSTSTLTSDIVISTLTVLELRGIVKQTSPMVYIKN